MGLELLEEDCSGLVVARLLAEVLIPIACSSVCSVDLGLLEGDYQSWVALHQS